MTSEPAYGLWSLVVVNSLVFIIFAFSFTKPRTERDWRSFSAFSAFIVALFVEMYGFPLTIYLISGWLVRRYPGLDPFSHDAGHLWNTLLGWKINPHFDPLHILSNILIFGGFILLSDAWKVLYEAQKTQTLAMTGPYAYVRHPQYVGFILIMLGFLFQWPTLVTLTMFPILVTMYAAGSKRGKGSHSRVWRRVSPLCCQNSGFSAACQWYNTKTSMKMRCERSAASMMQCQG
jgi:protein-S-isoprenylcysteine O-methyltransferase Ste14